MKAQQEYKRAVVVIFEQEYDSYYDQKPQGGDRDGYTLTVKAHPVVCKLDGTQIRNESYSSLFEHKLSGDMLDGFWVRVRTDRRASVEDRYEHEDVAYRDVVVVDAQKAAAMGKVFAAVAAGLQKDSKRDGWHRNGGQYLVRVARAIGATTVIMVKHGAELRGRGYDENWMDYVHLEMGDAVDAINSRISAWQNGQKERDAIRRY